MLCSLPFISSSVLLGFRSSTFLGRRHSHKLVTIPTPGWIDVAHRHGTRVLGTFITEWDHGYDVCAELLRSRETAERAADRLVKIAVDYGFDGWLINIENKIDPGANVQVCTGVCCVCSLKRSGKTSTPGSYITTSQLEYRHHLIRSVSFFRLPV